MSGGLDSILAAKILEEEGIEVNPICFKSFFFSCEQAEKAMEQLKLKLKIVDISEEHLKIIKNPLHGRGKGFNPCIDCHFLMIKTAKEIAKEKGYDFIATGEVLGQRPMSQNINSLNLIDKKANLSRLVFRPLSAKILPMTILEEKGIVKSIYSISGKGRGEQIKLAKKFKIKNYPSPAGGCILTDANYSKKLKELIKINPSFKGEDISILKIGRFFKEKDMLIIVARNEKECDGLIKLRTKNDVLLEPENFVGPNVLVRKYKKSSREEMINVGKKHVFKYSKKIEKDSRVRLLPFPQSL
jgi:hypothetical protein